MHEAVFLTAAELVVSVVQACHSEGPSEQVTCSFLF